MADEKEASEETPEKKGGKMGLIIGLVAIVIAAVGGFAVYSMVIAPMLAPEEGEVIVEEVNPIPTMPVNYPFEVAMVNLMRDGDESAGVLMFEVTFECANETTKTIIDTYKPRYVDMLNKLHSSRTRDEVDDILQFQLSVQRQAKQKANDMLKQMTPPDFDGDPPMVTGVFHVSCMATDAP